MMKNLLKITLFGLSIVIAYMWSRQWGGLEGTFEPVLAFFSAWIVTGGIGAFVIWGAVKALPGIVYIITRKRL